jgi:hypothetical protein
MAGQPAASGHLAPYEMRNTVGNRAGASTVIPLGHLRPRSRIFAHSLPADHCTGRLHFAAPRTRAPAGLPSHAPAPHPHLDVRHPPLLRLLRPPGGCNQVVTGPGALQAVFMDPGAAIRYDMTHEARRCRTPPDWLTQSYRGFQPGDPWAPCRFAGLELAVSGSFSLAWLPASCTACPWGRMSSLSAPVRRATNLTCWSPL